MTDKDSLPQPLPPGDPGLVALAANRAAAADAFQDYRRRRAPNTLRRQEAALALFARFLAQAGLQPGDLARQPEAWRGISWGLIAAFVRWLLRQGYAVGTVNVHLSTLKTYARLAMKAGSVEPGQYALIRAVEGYSRKEARKLDEARQLDEVPTRAGAKKAEPLVLTREQARALKELPADTPQGRRDRLLLLLMLDLGLRCGEVAALRVGDLDLENAELTFYRQKVDKVQTHRLTADLLLAAGDYLAHDAQEPGPLLRGSRRDGRLLRRAGLSARAINRRVLELGRRAGLQGLSPHDLRHTWATAAARAGTPLDRLQDAGGWASPAMPLRYIEAARIANTGVKLD